MHVYICTLILYKRLSVYALGACSQSRTQKMSRAYVSNGAWATYACTGHVASHGGIKIKNETYTCMYTYICWLICYCCLETNVTNIKHLFVYKMRCFARPAPVHR